MKKTALIIAFLSMASLSFAAGAKDGAQRVYESYEDTVSLWSLNLTLNRDTANIISTLTVPTEAKGFRIYAASAGIRFAIGTSNNSTPALAAVVVSTGPLTPAISSSSYAVGGIIKASIWESRLLPFNGYTRSLYLRAPTSGAVMDIEFFK